jgi:hypothetical protein
LDQKKREILANQVEGLLNGLQDYERYLILNDLINKNFNGLPISIFNAELSGLGVIVKYLKEIKKDSFKEIAKKLNRTVSTIYNTHRQTNIKFKGSLDVSDNSIIIPTSIFEKRKNSILESLVGYLKEEQDLSLKKIAILLHRNYNTVKTVYRRYVIKKNES